MLLTIRFQDKLGNIRTIEKNQKNFKYFCLSNVIPKIDKNYLHELNWQSLKNSF